MRWIWPGLLSVFLAGSVALAADPPPQLSDARALLERAETRLRDAARDSEDAQFAALGEAVTAHEAALAALRDGLRAMAREDRRLRQRLARERGDLGQVLRSLQTISNAPASALLAFPAGPVRSARAGKLIAAILPELKARASAVETQLDQLREVQILQEAVRNEARIALASLQDLRARTAGALKSRKRSVERSAFTEQAEAAARQAQTLGEMASVLQYALGSASPARAFEAAAGSLPPPVIGRVATRFGTGDPRYQSGIALAAPAYSQVVAPADAAIRYAGPLIGFDQVVILEPEEGWLMVLAGLGSVDVTIGETVLAGQRLGDLGGPLPSSEEFLIETVDGDGQIAEETLYIELRRGPTPVDPEPWFTGSD